MIRLCIITALLGTAAIATAGDDYARRGTRGTVTAYDLDGHTVIDNKICFARGRFSYDYVRCGERLRESVRFELCRKRGSGTHHWLYQVGDSRPVRTSVYCSRS
jgi:hypothetical protein